MHREFIHDNLSTMMCGSRLVSPNDHRIEHLISTSRASGDQVIQLWICMSQTIRWKISPFFCRLSCTIECDTDHCRAGRILYQWFTDTTLGEKNSRRQKFQNRLKITPVAHISKESDGYRTNLNIQVTCKGLCPLHDVKGFALYITTSSLVPVSVSVQI